MHPGDPFPFELTVTVNERTPTGIENAAYPVAERFFGAGAEVHVVSAKVHPEPDDDTFTATIVFRRMIV